MAHCYIGTLYLIVSNRYTPGGPLLLYHSGSLLLDHSHAQHKGYIHGRNAGGGHPRGPIFRLHVGAALINLGAGMHRRELLNAWQNDAPDPSGAKR